MDGEWLSAAEALQFTARVMPKVEAGRVIIDRCCAGLIESRAKKYVASYGANRADCKIPSFFWYSKPGLAVLDQNWIVGDFEQRNRKFHCEAFGVTFRKIDLVELLSGLEAARAISPNTSPSETPTRGKGGRQKHDAWSKWIAELVAYFHENGVPPGEGPQGQETIINAIDERLAGKGPARSTVQPAVQAALDRLRRANN